MDDYSYLQAHKELLNKICSNISEHPFFQKTYCQTTLNFTDYETQKNEKQN